jgi:hypothetical protein
VEARRTRVERDLATLRSDVDKQASIWRREAEGVQGQISKLAQDVTGRVASLA